MKATLLILAIVLLVILLLQGMIALYHSLKRLIWDVREHKLNKKLLSESIRIAKIKYLDKLSGHHHSWEGYRKFKVSKLDRENDQIVSVYLKAHNNKTLPPFHPGQFLTFNLNLPGGHENIVRCYSLSDCYNPDEYRVSVKKVPPPRDKDVPPGVVSNYFNDELKEGDILDVKAPSGVFYIDTFDKSPVVLIGGGIGITPVFSMLKSLIERNAQREIWFFYGIRNSSEQVFKEDFDKIKNASSNIHIKACYSNPLENDKEGDDYDYEERVSVELLKKVLPSKNYEFYICGPPPMMDSVVGDLKTWGVNDKKIHMEAFGPASVKKDSKDKKEKKEPIVAKVKFSKTGKEVDWKDGTDSILDFAEANGVDIKAGCRVGNCGCCLTALKSGEIEYSSDPHFQAEAGTCLTCIAVPKGDIELDA
jgi:uncharacterized protein